MSPFSPGNLGCVFRLIKRRTAIVLLLLSDHLVQNRQTGEQMTHWDKLNKENSNLVALFIMSQRVICSPVWRFCTTWSLSCKGPICQDLSLTITTDSGIVDCLRLPFLRSSFFVFGTFFVFCAATAWWNRDWFFDSHRGCLCSCWCYDTHSRVELCSQIAGRGYRL